MENEKTYKDFIMTDEDYKKALDGSRFFEHFLETTDARITNKSERCIFSYLEDNILKCQFGGFACTFCKRDVPPPEKLSDDEITITEDIIQNTIMEHERNINEYYMNKMKVYAHNEALLVKIMRVEYSE